MASCWRMRQFPSLGRAKCACAFEPLRSIIATNSLKQPEVWRIAGRDLTPVSDGAGQVDAVGPGVGAFAVGDQVMTLYFRNRPNGPPHPGMGMGLGSLEEDGVMADYVVLPAERLTRAPQTLSFAEAATLPCAGLTAWSALQLEHSVGRNSKVLALGTGGVSILALCFARSLGAELAATTSRDTKTSALRALGVRTIVNYKDVADWGQAVFDATGGVDKVVNAAGTGSLNQSMAALRPGGEVAVMGLMTFGEPLDALQLLSKGVSVRGTAVGSATEAEAMVRAVDELGVRPPIHRSFRFEELKAAYEAQVAPNLVGKVVLAFD